MGTSCASSILVMRFNRKPITQYAEGILLYPNGEMLLSKSKTPVYMGADSLSALLLDPRLKALFGNLVLKVKAKKARLIKKHPRAIQNRPVRRHTGTSETGCPAGETKQKNIYPQDGIEMTHSPPRAQGTRCSPVLWQHG